MLFCITKNTIIVTIYHYNPKVFVSWFCHNKSKPEMECNGQCQLYQIAEEQDRDLSSEMLSHLQKEVFFYYEASINYQELFEQKKYGSIQYFNWKKSFYSYLYIERNDKPPIV